MISITFRIKLRSGSYLALRSHPFCAGTKLLLCSWNWQACLHLLLCICHPLSRIVWTFTSQFKYSSSRKPFLTALSFHCIREMSKMKVPKIY